MTEAAAMHGIAENKAYPTADRLGAALQALKDVIPYAIAIMEDEVYEINEANGWFEGIEKRTFGDDIALLHSEVSEMLEAYRDHGFKDVTLHGGVDSLGKLTKPEGVGSEAADVLIRLLDTCRRHDIDLAAEFVRKNAFNRTRGHRHGGKIL